MIFRHTLNSHLMALKRVGETSCFGYLVYTDTRIQFAVTDTTSVVLVAPQ